MRCFFFLLFLPGVLCDENPLDVKPSDFSAWNGSCVVIPCKIQERFGRHPLDIVSVIWYFEPVYDNVKQEYQGTVLYNASRNPQRHMITTSPAFEGRVSFVGDLEKRSCSLKISQLQKNDSGVYLPRLYGLLESNQKKWGLKVPVKVMEAPPRPAIEIIPSEVKELLTTKITCSVPYHCPDERLMLTLSGLERHRMPSQKASENGKIQTTVTFEPTWEDHGKTMRCLLSRQDGSEISQSALLLNVNYAPKGLMLKATPGATVQVGEKLSLECTVNSSNPVAQYHWYKDRVNMYKWTGQKIELNSVEEHDAGTYTCEVTNVVGNERKDLRLDVQYSPKDTTVIVPAQVIKEGARVVLECCSRGNPPIDLYKWYKNTPYILYSTGQELRFLAIQPNNSGTYYCVAQNRLGNSSSPPIKLDVLHPPKNVNLASQNPLSIEEGNTVTLNCSVGSSNPPTSWYKWFINGRVKKSERGNLWIFRAARRDAGSYHCEACNSVGCIASMPVLVDVLYGPLDVNVVQEPTGQIREGIRVQMTCSVRMANPKELTYVWYKDNQQWQQTSADATRTLSKVTPADSGTYSCEARNSVGKSWSSAVTLDVLYGPQNIYVSLSISETITEGMDLKMLCKSDANPPPNSYEWYWDEEWRPFENSRILNLPKVQVTQSGIYRCRAKNIISMGESKPLYLTVSLSRAIVLKRTLIGLGTAFFLLLFLGFLVFGLRNCSKKEVDPGTGRTRRASFFVKKAKGEKPCCNNRSNVGRTEHSLGFLNPGAEAQADISYSTIMFPPSFSEDRTEYACIKGPSLAMAPANDTVIYSAVKKPRVPSKTEAELTRILLPQFTSLICIMGRSGHRVITVNIVVENTDTNGDTKHDYENVENNQDEELHYSSLMNLSRQPCPAYRDTDTDSESEESIQYASLKH